MISNSNSRVSLAVFKLFVWAPLICTAFQVVSWYIGQSTLGEVLLSAQAAILAFELRRYLWSEKDLHEYSTFLFQRKVE